MALDIPDSAAEVKNRAQTDVERELPGSNPRLKNSWLFALVTGYANRIFDFYTQLTIAISQNFPDTATGSFLERWAAIWGKERLAATQASGNIVGTGVDTSPVPISTSFTFGSAVYTSTAASVIAAQVENVTSITRSGTTATVTTDSDHELANNVPTSIAGAVETEYNVADAVITVTGPDTFEYQVSGSPSTPATGTITASHTSVSTPVTSDDFGIDTNLAAGSSLKLQTPIVGVDDTFVVDFGQLGGGTNQESNAGLRDRTLDRIQNPVANFNVAAITDKAKEVAGVTRVFVEEITPAVGQVTVYFMRDNDPDPIPSGSEVAEVRAKIEEIVPANTDKDNDLFVNAPTGVPVAFTFTALSPDTSTMQSAIQANLAQFFDEDTVVSADIKEDAYRSAIFNTIDTATGDTVTSFTLSVPSGDITIATGEIGTLGTVSFT